RQQCDEGAYPATGKPYTWFGGELGNIKREDLPYVRYEDAKQFLEAAIKLLGEEFGFAVKTTNLATDRTGDDGSHDIGENAEADPALIRAALNVIPNNVDWERWYTIGMAVWRATRGSGDGFAAWDEWSKKSPKYNAHTPSQKWAAFFKSPPTRIGAGTGFAELAKPAATAVQEGDCEPVRLARSDHNS